MKNLIAPLNRAHQVVLGTSMERVEQVSGRLAAGITRILRGRKLAIRDNWAS